MVQEVIAKEVGMDENAVQNDNCLVTVVGDGNALKTHPVWLQQLRKLLWVENFLAQERQRSTMMLLWWLKWYLLSLATKKLNEITGEA